MYLSRIKLDTKKRATMIAFLTPSMFHGSIESAFSGEREHCLWRIDKLNGDCYLLILSDNEPCLSHVAEEYGIIGTGETLSYDELLNKLIEGSKWQFRLSANPTYRTPVKPGEKRGRLCAHTTVTNQREWLLRKCESHGFTLATDSFDVVSSRWYKFGKNNHTVSLLAVTYEGILTITNESKFKETMRKGIGRGKAYGMGLLTVMHPEM